ncbi:hypothetical protein J6590_045053 [Homalodisca vitripennis]|nr:hypothetical protein J6590_045053 [Homalodisca vitripennis]
MLQTLYWFCHISSKPSITQSPGVRLSRSDVGAPAFPLALATFLPVTLSPPH